jgi:Flp pilus assembly CpaE family ATPase
MDEISRIVGDLSHKIMLVAQTDVVTLWSSSRIQAWLEQVGGEGKVGLVLNRHKKIAGFSDEDVAKAANAPVLWKVPNSYHPVASGIDRGEPIIFQDNDLSRSIRALATMLAKSDADGDSNSRVPASSGTHSKATTRLVISPLRAGQ